MTREPMVVTLHSAIDYMESVGVRGDHARQADLAVYTAIGGLTGADFVKSGANVDYATGNNLDEASGATVSYLVNGLPAGDVAVATPWFTTYMWIDWGQGQLGQWSLSTGDIGGGCAGACNESLAYRVHQAVPEPSSLMLLGLGLVGLGLSRRKKAA